MKHKNSDHLQLIRNNAHLSVKELSELTGLSSYTIVNIKNKYGIKKHYALTDKDCKEIESLARFLTPKQIAEKLNIPHKKTYLYIYHKLGIRYINKN